MKDRPIIFSAPMVRAILEGRKTQTRRVVKPQPVGERLALDLWEDGIVRKCPYGKPGDRLWVRETWQITRNNDLTPSEVDGAIKWYHNPDHMKVVFRADADPLEDIDPRGRGKKKWRPSIHMPRAASRILLEITDVRVDRLHEITQEDAMEEGFELTGWRPTYNDPDSGGEIWTPKDNFIEMWERIYGPESWSENPWIWVITFKKIEP